MLKRVIKAVCVMTVLGFVGCSTHDRYNYVMPSSMKPASTAVYNKPAPVVSASKPAVPTALAPAHAAVAKPTVNPAPAPAVLKDESVATTSISSSPAYRLKEGDPIVIYLRGIPGVPGGEQQIEDVIDEHGAITLPYVGNILAGGKTGTEIEQLIQKTYIDQQIYKYVSVNVMVPSRSYYVRGEVKQPGRFPLLSRVTVIQAVAAAGGFTEFANPSKVEILRGSQRIRVDVAEVEKHPERDTEIESGDVLIVQRSFF